MGPPDVVSGGSICRGASNTMAGATIAVASDHAGFDLKETLKSDLQQAGYAVLDLGTNSTASVDYPDFGAALAAAVAREALKVFLATPFAGGRHAPRVAKLSREAKS